MEEWEGGEDTRSRRQCAARKCILLGERKESHSVHFDSIQKESDS